MHNLTRPEGSEPEDFHITRRAATGMFFAGYALAAVSAQASPIRTGDDGLTIEEVLIPNGTAKPLPAYLARPKGRGRRATVIVVNEIFGLHAYIQDVCRRLAKQGYVAMAPGYFAREGDPSLMTDFADIMAVVRATPNGQVMADTGAALRYLAATPFADVSKAGITGFCWGGTVVWMACAAHDFKAGAAWYGRLVRPAQNAEADRLYPNEIADQLRCPVLGLYAENDQGIPLDSVETMRQALAAAGRTDSEIIVYPGTDHGFHADYRPMYDAAAAADGWARMLRLFGERLA